MDSSLKKIQEWYGQQCNGMWEHSWGVRIDTTDNPGWVVEIDLDQTIYEDEKWDLFFMNESDQNWIRCIKDCRTFRGAGDPSKLEEILDYFLGKISKSIESAPAD